MNQNESAIESVRWVGRDAVVKVTGEVDLNRSVDFQQDLMRVVEERPARMVIDLSGVPYMDSSGVASLVKLLSRTRRYGIALALAAMTDRVRSVFEITRLDGVFTVKATVEEALG